MTTSAEKYLLVPAFGHIDEDEGLTIPEIIAMHSKKQYHGWIVVEEATPGLLPRVYVEHTSGDNKRRRLEMKSGGNGGCTQAIEWWDKKLKANIKLEPLMKGCYRVYTE